MHVLTSLITRVVYLSFFMSSIVGNRSPRTESTYEREYSLRKNGSNHLTNDRTQVNLPHFEACTRH